MNLGQLTGHVLGKLDSDVYFSGYTLRLPGQPQSVNCLFSCPRNVLLLEIYLHTVVWRGTGAGWRLSWLSVLASHTSPRPRTDGISPGDPAAYPSMEEVSPLVPLPLVLEDLV